VSATGSPPFDLAGLERALRTAALGRVLEHHPSLGSTSDRAAELARAGASHGATVVADEQLRGRGRRGRVWHSVRGQGLWASVVLRPARPVEDHAQLALAAGLAVADLLASDLAAPGVTLRWPNDVDLRGRKVAGILCESAAGPAGPAVIAGIGINVGPGAVPPELEGAATSLAREDIVARREDLLGALLGRLEARFEAWQGGGFAALRGDYLARVAPCGREVRLTGVGVEAREVRGIFETVDLQGTLVLRTARGPERFHAGQVERVR
jgi:BirA family biotin operon repressor/biotin-[acetyl-CoA-carboxylase] ligase